MRWLKVIALGAACAMTGCEGKIAKTEIVPLDKVPPAAIKAAEAKLPEVKFDTAWKTKSGNYEIRGKTPGGKVRDLQVTAAGDVVEVD